MDGLSKKDHFNRPFWVMIKLQTRPLSNSRTVFFRTQTAQSHFIFESHVTGHFGARQTFDKLWPSTLDFFKLENKHVI